MDVIVIFGKENAHPLSWMLSAEIRHVWCAIRDTNRGVWVSYDWHKGIPFIRAEAASDFDLAQYYRDAGNKVVEMKRGTVAARGPFMLNNCVGHVQVVCALHSLAFTPYQLYHHLTQDTLMDKLWTRIKSLSFVPGGGDGDPDPPPPPPPPPPPEPPLEQAEAADPDAKPQRKRQRGKGGTRGVAGGTLIDEADLVTGTPTLKGTRV